MNPATKRQPAHSPAQLLGIVKGFLDACRTPIAVEPGLQPVRIEPGSYALEEHRSGCVLHVWGEGGNIVRRITSIRSELSKRLDVRVRRFGASDTTLSAPPTSSTRCRPPTPGVSSRGDKKLGP